MQAATYHNLSDLLADVEAVISTTHRPDPRYADITPEIDMLLAIMEAIRRLPGLDAPPDAPNYFDADVCRAAADLAQRR